MFRLSLRKIRWSLVLIVALCWLPLIIGHARTSIWQWSETASSNASADPTVNWREGQPPSSVNDSARAMMAVLAAYRDDISGATVTTGTSVAYSLATNSAFAGETFTSINGQMFSFTVHTTNGTGVTLNVDALGAKPLRSSPGIDLTAGVLVQGSPYVAIYNNANGEFYLKDFYPNPNAVPVGTVLPYSASAAPGSNFVLAYGQCISRATYSVYFGLVSTTYGACDGLTTFGVPDLRGRILIGLDNMGGVAANRVGSVVTDSGTIVGTTLGSVGGSATHVETVSEMAQHNHTVADPGHTHTTGATTAAIGGAITVLQPPGTGAATASAQTGITLGNAGSSSAMSLLQPSMILVYILRVI